MGTVSNALKILNHFPSDTDGIGLADLTRASRQNKTTVYRHLCELAANAFVEQDLSTRKYRVGPALTRLAQARAHPDGTCEALTPLVVSLSRSLDTWCVLYEVVNARLQPRVLMQAGRSRDPDGYPVFCDPHPRLSSAGLVLQSGLQGEPARHGDGAVPGFVGTPDVVEDDVQSLSAPVMGCNGTLAFVVTLVMPTAARRPFAAETYSTALTLAASAATSVIGGLRRHSNNRSPL